MIMKLSVNISTHASAVVTVEFTDEKLAQIAEDLGVEVDALTVDDLTDAIYETMETPGICAQCAGWGRDYGLELGDEWEIDDDPKEKNPDYRGIRIVK